MLIRLKNVFRTRTTRAAIMPIALALSVLLGATPAMAAHPVHVPLAGQDHRFFGAATTFEVVGDELHVTGQHIDGPFNFGALVGTEYQLIDARLNLVTGKGKMSGTVTYVDTVHNITCVAATQGQIRNFLATGTVKGRCSDGSTIRLELQDVYVTPGVDGVSNYWGELTYK
ncbi:MAG: hypothetical protein ABI847_17825 [Anaerolineales bacterium]